MKKIFLIMMMISLSFSSEYVVDKKSTVKFEATKFLFIGVDGEFTKFSGTITLDENNKLSEIKAMVSIASLDTKEQERDDHLKSDEYFSMGKYPNIEFSSKSIKDDSVLATVSIKGIEKELEFKIANLEVSEESVSFSLSSKVDRHQFMLNGSKSAVIGNNVDVMAEIIANK